MIKKRNNVNVKIEREVVENTTSRSTLFNNDIKTYKDEAILVLNLLEKQNVDIYNTENTPGMYLKGKNKNSIPETLKQQFKKTGKIINKTPEEEKENIQKFGNLFQYLKNNK